MKQNNNNNGDRYGNLLNNYMKSIEKKEYSHMLEHEAGKHREEGKDRYGDLLKNAKKNNKIYDDILNMDKANRMRQQREAEEEYMFRIRQQERIEKAERELQERIDRNTAAVNNMLAKKKAEEDALKQKNKEEAEKAEFYKRVENLIEISPRLAEVYIKTQKRF